MKSSLWRPVAAVLSAGLVPVTPAAGQAVTRQHARQYSRAYHLVAREFGRRAPGRNILRWGLADHQRPSDARLLVSLGVLLRDLAPPPVAVVPLSTSASTVQTPSISYQQSPGSGLAQCIIQHESSGNPQATNGQYKGIGQWSPDAWAQDGGRAFAPSPLGASYSQQVAVLNGEGTAGMQQQQGQYDGC